MNNDTGDQPLDRDATLTVEPIPPAEPSTVHKIFIGRDVLRAGWSLLIFIAIFAAIAFCANRIGRILYPPPPKSATPKEISPLFGSVAEAILADTS